MKGHNELNFNQAQMNDAIEYYLKNVFLKEKAFEVSHVGKAHGTNGGFTIKIHSIEETEKEEQL